MEHKSRDTNNPIETQPSDEIKQASPSKNTSAPATKKENQTIIIGLVVMVIIFFAAIAVLISTTNNEPPAENTADQALLDEVELENPAIESPYGSIVMFSEQTQRFVPVPVDESQTVAINITQPGTDKLIDYTQLRTEFVAAELFEQNFVEYETEPEALAMDDELNYRTRYRNDSIICVLTMQESGYLKVDGSMPEIGDGYGWIIKTCADEQLADQVGNAMKQYYEGYDSSIELTDETYDYVLYVNESDITQSSNVGYEYVHGGVASIGYVGGASVTYARETGGTWEFVVGGHELPLCSSFATTTAQRALADSICIDGAASEETTVAQFYQQ